MLHLSFRERAVKVLGGATALLLAVSAQGRVAEIATVDHAAVDSGNLLYDEFDDAVLNAAGEIAFATSISPAGVGNNQQLLVKGTEDGLAVLQRDGNPIGQTGYRADFIANVRLNDAGQVAANVGFDVFTSPSDLDGGLFRFEGDGGVTQIALRVRDHEDVAQARFRHLGNTSLNAAGDVGYYGANAYTTSGQPPVDDRYVMSFRSDTNVQIARNDDPMPDGNGDIAFTGFGGPALQQLNDGRVVFDVDTVPDQRFPTDDTGWLISRAGNLSIIVREGDPLTVPGVGSVVAADTFGLPPIFSTNGKGVQRFGYADPTTNDYLGEAIYRLDPNTAQRVGDPILQAGQTVAGLPGPIRFLINPQINADGDVLTYTFYEDPSAPNGFNGALLIDRGSGPQVFLQNGDPLPGGEELAVNLPAFNDRGVAAFRGTAVDPSGQTANQAALFLADGQEVVELLRVGAAWEGSTIESFIRSPRFNVGGTSTFNDHGQVLFEAELADGRRTLGLATPDLAWRGSASTGDWDQRGNWTLGLPPGGVHDVTIAPDTGVTVTGPALPTAVRRLTLGGGNATTTLDLQPGGRITADTFTLEGNGTLRFTLGSPSPAAAPALFAEQVIDLDGRLSLVLDAGFDDGVGTTYRLLETDGTITGKFTSFEAPTLAAGRAWRLERTHQLVQLVVGETLFDGDYNGDGEVSQEDLALVLANWGRVGLPLGWVALDQYDNSMVSQRELALVLSNWGRGITDVSSLAAPVIPEPTTAALLLPGLLLFRRRDR
jgi:hypothetical protein